MENSHARHIEAWIELAGSDLSQKELVLLFEQAIQAIWARSLTPLSEVTLTAIFERVLSNTQKKFPLLSHIKIEPEGVGLKGLNGKAVELSIDELKRAFRFFLV